MGFLVKIPLVVHRLTWAACLGSAPLAKTPPWQLRGLTTISPLLEILGRHITASFRKDGLKEWGILLVVCPPSSSGCRQHRPSTLSWRVLQGIDHNNQVIETNTRCHCKTSIHRVHSHGRIVFACNFRHNFPDMSCIN